MVLQECADLSFSLPEDDSAEDQIFDSVLFRELEWVPPQITDAAAFDSVEVRHHIRTAACVRAQSCLHRCVYCRVVS